MGYDEDARYSSSLAPNATVAWSQIQIASATSGVLSTQALLSVSFPNIDWLFLQGIYGWAALQYQAWARGTLSVSGDEVQTVVLHTEGLLEFLVDGVRHFGGDYYSFKRAPLVLRLEPGEHVLELRLVRDVRAMGGVGTPSIDICLTAQISSQDLHISTGAPLLPDMVDGTLAGALGSVLVRNDAVNVLDAVDVSVNDTAWSVWLMEPERVRVASGQTRPVAFVIQCNGICSPDIEILIEYEVAGSRHPTQSYLRVPYRIPQRDIHDPHKMTFLHPGGMVSYAILRPPLENVSCPLHGDLLPILMQLHGAGLEADSDLVKHALDPLPDLCAFTLFPTGSTPWSGDDWHAWGFADVQAAVDALPGWVYHTGWQGPKVDVHRWLVSGHSNGGQGTWFALTHHPDKIIAAAPVSGYSSIQSASSTYVELKGENHWFEGIMTTDPLRSFYRRQLNSAGTLVNPPRKFTLVVANPADTGSKHGVKVLQLDTPNRLGKVEVSFSHSACNIRTSNVLSLELPSIYLQTHDVEIDGQLIELPLPMDTIALWRAPGRTWRVIRKGERFALRQERQLGPMDAFLRTQGTIQIIAQSPMVDRIVLQISRNLCQYFAADTNIVLDDNRDLSGYGNVVRVVVGGRLPSSVGVVDALQTHDLGITMRTSDDERRTYLSDGGLGAIFLRPLEPAGLELVVWGVDEEGLEIAARLVPMLTGVGQPDFVIADKRLLWEGAAGVLAMGSFDHSWNVTRESYVT
ncbi:hypothetical protein MBLNU459_g3861t1 [Dothideomycetes sp. NU459]